MKKRILCFVLTLIMLIGLVPVAAMPAAAASNKISEKAVTVLKNLEGGYSKYCNNGFIGYGEKCPECKGVNRVDCKYKSKAISEKQADSNLRTRLAELDKAVNSFADKNGLSFASYQHDALVIFSFENGTAWTLGTGEFQTAIKSGYTGSKFLDAICKWEYSILDDNRRMVEANMYLNGVYSSERPSRYIRVTMDPQETYGFMYEDNKEHLHYFDVASPVTITLAPAPKNVENTFLGWYMQNTEGDYVRVTTLTSAYHGKDLIARYQDDQLKAGESYNDILYTTKKANLASTTVYGTPNGTKVTTFINELGKEVNIKLEDTLYVVNDFIDEKGVHWALIAHRYEDEYGTVSYYPMGWVKVKGAGSSVNTGLGMDVTVTVTNTYVNMRKNASITSAKNGSFNMGDTLRIINTKNGSDGFLWGQVAASADDATPIGWIALMYTDYDSVIASANASAPEKSLATATIVAPVNGYVNVRSDAGINNQIVGALSYGVTVELYEVKYVNGIQWGRCSTGWFCLTYALVSGLDTNAGTGEAGFTNYIYVVTLTEWVKGMTVMSNGSYEFYYAPNQTPVTDAYEKDAKGEFVLDKNGDKILSKITSNQLKIAKLRAYEVGDDIQTWAYTPYGWLQINEHSKSADDLSKTDMATDFGIKFEAKYYAIDEDVTVRTAPKSSAPRINILTKGVEFNVHEIVMVNESIWGYADKEGRVYDKTTGTDMIASYDGWINLSNRNVSRNANDNFNIEDSSSASGTTIKMARVVGTDSLRVRNTGASYGTVIGSLSMGTTAAVLDEKDGWYLLDIDVDNNPATGSWCSGSYLELYDEVQGGSSASGNGTSGAIETGLGMVANTYTGVNIRSGAGTAYPATGKYLTGTTVEILEVKTVGAAKWGRTEKGWVCMDYIAMVDKYAPAGSGNNTTTNNSTISSNVVIYTGVINTDGIIVYSNTNTVSDDGSGVGGSEPVGATVRVLNTGDPVTVHELITQVEYDEVEDSDTQNDGENSTIKKRTTYWARVNEGYIYAPGYYIDLYALDEHEYTVETADTKYFEDYDDWSLVDTDIRNDDYIGKFAAGTKVYVTKLHIRHNEVWCFAENANALTAGWVRLSNLDKGFASSTEPEVEEEEENTTVTEPTGPSTVIGSTGNTGGSVSASGYKYTGKIINTNQVNVRATASTTANVTTTLKSGASLVIYETVISEFMAWGRCDSGWVYLYYVDLTPVGSGAVDARVVYNDNTVIYKDMGMSEATGSTYAKMAVVDIYEIVGKMARTEMGWIHTDNLL